MALFSDVTRRQPSSNDSQEKKVEDKPRRTERPSSNTNFFNRRIRLTGDSSLSVPLALVLLFPCLVLGLITMLFWQSPSPDGLMNMPAGTPPSIRYVSALLFRTPLQPLTATRKISEKYDKVFAVGCLEPQVNAPRANAAFVVLARNKELDGVIQSIKSIERHFNRWFHYPYVFLNDGDFNQTFKDTVLNHTSGSVEWGHIPPEDWGYPDWVDPAVAKEGIKKQGDRAIMYGHMESYHHMCRFYSG
jgi:mannosyltransferase